MADKLIDLGNGFYNIRGSFKIGGLIDVGTQSSLVRLESGKFIFLDSYSLTGSLYDEVMALTNQGADVEAVLNLHPFHTVYCEQLAKDFPSATFYGSARHKEHVPAVDWADDLVESETVMAKYPELKFSMPEGIYYISPNEKIHAGSLLAYHPASQSLHVDDTFVSPPNKLLGKIMPELSLHPTTKMALKKDVPNAGELYCDWATDLAVRWNDVSHFCAAHSGVVYFEEGQFETALLKAIAKIRPKLVGK